MLDPNTIQNVIGGYQAAKAAGTVTITKISSGVYQVNQKQYDQHTGAVVWVVLATVNGTDMVAAKTVITNLLADLTVAIADGTALG